MTQRAHPEADLQRAVVAYLNAALPADAWFTAINPVPAKSKAVAGLSKAMGLVPGVPDLVILWHGETLWVELKSRTGWTNAVQRACMLAIADAGAEIAVCRDIDEVAAALEGFGMKLRAKVSA